MKLNVNELKNKLDVLEKSYSAKGDSIYQFLHFDNGKMTVSNGNSIIKTKINYDNEEDFKCLIPFKIFRDIVSKLNYDSLQMELKDNQIEIISNKSKFCLNLGVFDDYPLVSIKKLEKSLEINSSDFKRYVKNVVNSCATNKQRPILEGINFGKNGIIATDSFRLSQCKMNINDEMNITIHKNDILNLIKILPSDENLEISYNDREILFAFKGFLYKTKLLEGNYPNVDRILENNYDKFIKLNKNELKECLERNNVFNSEFIVMEFSENKIKIINKTNEYGNCLEEMDCNCDFNLKIAFSYKYLLEAINTFENDEIEICLKDWNKPFIIICENEENNIQMILPIKGE